VSPRSTGFPRLRSLITHPYPLRSDLNVFLELPPDLTAEEAERLARHIRTLAFTEPKDSGS
jgi:hypothetical protein